MCVFFGQKLYHKLYVNIQNILIKEIMQMAWVDAYADLSMKGRKRGSIKLLSPYKSTLIIKKNMIILIALDNKKLMR